MTQQEPDRRSLLGAAAGLAAFGSVAASSPTPAHASGTSTTMIDAVLRQAVDAKDVPGVVAMAASDKGVFYQAAFGTRDLAKGPPMTVDTVFRIASMTKLVTSVAVLQLVEQGKLGLNDPVPPVDPALSAPQVLDGFDGSGVPILRPAKRPITLRHLLTHTAGFSYEQWDANTARYVKTTGMPSTPTGKTAALRLPLAFDPGERWEYGVNIDWVGLIVEAISGQKLDAYVQHHIAGPLGMKDTTFMTSPDQRARQTSVHQRVADGSLQPQPLETPFTPEFWAGGGGLYSTAGDYLTLLRAILHAGALDGTRILRPETVALMSQNHIGNLEAGILKTTAPARSTDVDFFPGSSLKWGLGTMINAQPGPNGRSADTLTWAGIFNTHYWIDPARRLAAVLMTQVLPFGDPTTMRLYGQYERSVYDAMNAA